MNSSDPSAELQNRAFSIVASTPATKNPKSHIPQRPIREASFDKYHEKEFSLDALSQRPSLSGPLTHGNR